MPRINLHRTSLPLHSFFADLSVPLPYYFYLPQSSMTSKKEPVFTLHATFVPVPNMGGIDPFKRSHLSGVSSIVSDPSSLYPKSTDLPYDFPSNTPIHLPTNTQIDPTEAFKHSVNNIIEAIPMNPKQLSFN